MNLRQAGAMTFVAGMIVFSSSRARAQPTGCWYEFNSSVQAESISAGTDGWPNDQPFIVTTGGEVQYYNQGTGWVTLNGTATSISIAGFSSSTGLPTNLIVSQSNGNVFFGIPSSSTQVNWQQERSVSTPWTSTFNSAYPAFPWGSMVSLNTDAAYTLSSIGSGSSGYDFEADFCGSGFLNFWGEFAGQGVSLSTASTSGLYGGSNAGTLWATISNGHTFVEHTVSDLSLDKSLCTASQWTDITNNFPGNATCAHYLIGPTAGLINGSAEGQVGIGCNGKVYQYDGTWSDLGFPGEGDQISANVDENGTLQYAYVIGSGDVWYYYNNCPPNPPFPDSHQVCGHGVACLNDTQCSCGGYSCIDDKCQ